MLLAYGHWKPVGRGANCIKLDQWEIVRHGESKTYAGCLARADVEGEAGNVTRVTHEDGSSDLLLSSRRNRNGSAGETLIRVASTAVSVVHDLATLESRLSIQA